MTATTPESIGLTVDEPRRPSPRIRFAVAFLVGIVLATVVGVGALYAYDQSYLGRVLPGVRLGSLDLSGLDQAAAAERIAAEYAWMGEGTVVVRSPDGDLLIPYASFDRGPDVDAMVAEAMAVGRAGNPVSRVIEDARTAVNGRVLEPMVTYDADALADTIGQLASALDASPRDAWVTTDADGRFRVVDGINGRAADGTAAIAAAFEQLGAVDAPAVVDVDLDVSIVVPTITTVEATVARQTADRVTRTVALTIGDDTQKISIATLRKWITFGPTADGGYAATLDTSGLGAVVKKAAAKLDRAPINASFRTNAGGSIIGVTSSHTGYRTDVKATVAKVQALLDARLAGAIANATVHPTTKVTQPALTTAEARAAWPRMRRVSTWTTYFPITIKNGFGANIWLPAKLINGYVVAPHAKFDFWEAVGPVSRDAGFKQGGAIINGRTEPQGALGGGICSCSTTLFNAALRAGYEMGARRNHYYYIDRYPLGLDATVFKTAGSTVTMSFTNDTDYPILIRGINTRDGNRGYVRFDLYTVPTGRTVSFSRPIVKDVRPASDTVQYTSALPPGATERVEYPVDGKKVWVTRTVRDRNGNVIHKDTYYSNYKRITGILLIGRAAETAPDTNAGQ
jgi:vancomycin resistance protein YoaR